MFLFIICNSDPYISSSTMIQTSETLALQLHYDKVSVGMFVMQSNLAYPDSEYPETSLSGRIWTGTDCFHYIHTRIYGNPYRNINLGNVTINSNAKISPKSTTISVCSRCTFVISLSKISLWITCMNYHLKVFVTCHKSCPQGVDLFNRRRRNVHFDL